MPEFNPKARENLNRSTHPDLQRAEDGSLEFREDAFADPQRRLFNRRWQDPSERAAMMAWIGHQQAELPVEIQREVAGREFFGYGGDAYDGFLEYAAEINDLRSANPGEVSGADVSHMDLDTYDKFFDSNGRPRPGVSYSPTGRDVDVRSSGIDPFSAQELRTNR